MTPKTEKPSLWIFTDEFDDIVRRSDLGEGKSVRVYLYPPTAWTRDMVKFIEFSAVTELEQRVKESEFLAKENPALHQRIGTILNEHDKTKAELTAAQEKIKELEEISALKNENIANLIKMNSDLSMKLGAKEFDVSFVRSLFQTKVLELEAENQKLIGQNKIIQDMADSAVKALEAKLKVVEEENRKLEKDVERLTRGNP